MSKRPVNLTIHQRVLDKAEAIMQLEGYTSISAFVEELIRDEYTRQKEELKKFAATLEDDDIERTTDPLTVTAVQETPTPYTAEETPPPTPPPAEPIPGAEAIKEKMRSAGRAKPKPHEPK